MWKESKRSIKPKVDVLKFDELMNVNNDRGERPWAAHEHDRVGGEQASGATPHYDVVQTRQLCAKTKHSHDHKSRRG